MQANVAEQPLLSIGLIVKNEETHLENCLKALQPLRDAIPCQLVIADTGSTDNTVEIAKKYADEVFYFEWIDDFAAARNAVMDRCTGEWYLSVDADEYLREESVPQIVEFLEKEAKDYNTARLTIYNWNADEKRYTEFFGVRLCRMSTGLRYIGRIHEILVATPPVKKMPKVIFDHYGYFYATQDDRKKKSERNMKLMREEYKSHPKDVRLLTLLIDSCLDTEEKLGYVERALELTREKFQTADQMSTQEKYESVATYQLATIAYYEAGKYEEAQKIGKEALRIFPDHPSTLIDVNFTLGVIAYNDKNWEQVVEYTEAYQKAYHRWKEEPAWRDLVMNLLNCESEFMYQKILVCLLTGYYHLERFEDALHGFSELEIEDLTQESFKEMLLLLIILSTKMNITDMLQHWYQTCMVDLKGQEEKEYFFIHFSQQILRGFLMLLQDKGGEDEEIAFSFLKSLAALQGEDDMLRLVRLAVQEKEGALSEEEFAQNVREYLNSIENWEEIPAAAYAMALRAGVTVPRKALLGGFQMMSDKANWLAANQPQFVELLSRLSENWDWNSDILTLTWYVLLWTAALNTMVSVEDHAKRELIFDKYCEAEGLYLQQFFNPAILNAEGIQAFPPIHQFGFYAVQAQKQLKNRDLVGALGTMKHVAEVNQDVKKLVQAITEVWTQREEEAKNAKDEMSQLAQSLKLGIQALVQTGREHEAKEALEKYIKICPNDTSMMEMLRQLEGKDYRLLQ